jgi:hypothetical protein
MLARVDDAHPDRRQDGSAGIGVVAEFKVELQFSWRMWFFVGSICASIGFALGVLFAVLIGWAA